MSELKNDIYRMVTNAYKYLYKEGQTKFFWGDVRSTALVGLALVFRESLDSKWLKEIENNLYKNIDVINENFNNWNEEIWDTAMALLCLNEFGTTKNPIYQKALKWVHSMFNLNGRFNWHDEPWETSWAILGLLKCSPDDDCLIVVNNSLKWLYSLQDEDGKIIAPHYTAYYILSIFLFIEQNPNLNPEDIETLRDSQKKAAYYLISIIENKILWTGEAWSNGQILWAIASSNYIDINDQKLISMITNWFEKNQEEKGNWADYEDTASAIIGLNHLLEVLEKTDSDFSPGNIVFNTLRRFYDTPTLVQRIKFIKKEDEYTIITLSPRFKKIFVISLGIITIVSTLIGFWSQISGFFTSLFGG